MSTFLRKRVHPTQQMVAALVNVEMAYIKYGRVAVPRFVDDVMLNAEER